MSATQLDIFEAMRQRELGMARVASSPSMAYRLILDSAIAHLAHGGDSFCADQVRQLAGEPPEGCSHNVIGVAVNAALKRGQVEVVGQTRSARVVGHGNRLLLLKGRNA